MPVLVIDEEVALRRAVDAVGPVKAGVEPLRRVRRRLLRRQHEAQLVAEGAGVVLGIEVAALPAPVRPGAGQPVEHLLGAALAAASLRLGQRRERLLVGGAAPQPGRHAVFADGDEARRHAGLAEVLLRQHIARDLRPRRRDLDVLLTEHHRAVRIADLAARDAELYAGIRRTVGMGEQPRNAHGKSPTLRCERWTEVTERHARRCCGTPLRSPEVSKLSW